VIYYLVTKENADTIERFLRYWGRLLAGSIQPLFYQDLVRGGVLRPGTYIFSDIERLRPEGAELVAKIWEQLSASGKSFRLLNHPTRSMRRYELLRALYERGINRFNVYRLSEGARPQSYPVFLRGENGHLGPRTPLLFSEEELGAAVTKMLAEGLRREDILIVGFRDTSDAEGKYRLYSAFNLGGRIVPAGIDFGPNWLVKPSLRSWEEIKQMRLDPAELAEEVQHVEADPHEKQMREIVQMSAIDYGRADYSVLDGAMQVWEINTNPQIVMRAYLRPERELIARHICGAILSAFNKIDWPPYGTSISSLDC
jgi:hypothetical protein